MSVPWFALLVIAVSILMSKLTMAQGLVQNGDTVSATLQILALNDLPQLGDCLPIDLQGSADTCRIVIMATPSQFWNWYRIAVDSVYYELGVTDSGQVRYIATYDTTFVTPDGLALSSTVTDTKEHAVTEMYRLAGWGYVLPLRSGWQAAWCVGYTCTDSLPKPDQTVCWFFKGGN